MRIPVFYAPQMVADSQSSSPSAAKPEKVVASWQARFPIEVIEPQPVTVEELCRAHDWDYVRGVLEGRIDNGFGNRSLAVAASLVHTSGAMLSAARHALATRSVAAAPCSGFHHAGFTGYEGLGMFCTFNGLMVAALALKEAGVGKVGILDLDMHYGNGTADIIRRLGLSSWVTHFTGGASFDDPHEAPEFFGRWLPDVLAWLSDCDVVLYQAGADPHISDPYGGWLTTEQLRHRDAVVFDALKAADVPVAWNLAGGYQVEPDGTIPKVLEIHDNTMRECVRAYGAG
jgi:acetoin utilization deacetylase AcuC-like enzyme